MDFVPDSLAFLMFPLGGVGVVLAMAPERYRLAELLVGYLFVLLAGVPAASLDVPVPLPLFSEICLAVCALALIAAFARYAWRELSEGEYG